MSGDLQAVEATAGPARVLIVDDSRSDYELCQLLLETTAADAWALDWVGDFADGLQALEREDHEIALIDAGLGGRDGVELIGAARRSGCTIPLILFTGSEDPRVERRAIEAGATDFLSKLQLDGRTLHRACRRALQRKRLIDAQEGDIRRLSGRNKALQILLHAADGLVVCSLRGRIVYLNPAAEALLGDIVEGRPAAAPASNLADLADGDDLHLPGSGAGERVVSVSSRELLWDDQPCRLLSLRDVTAARRFSEQVHQTEKMALMGQIAGGIAHDFNNLMMAVVGSIDLARGAVLRGASQEEHLERAALAATHAAELTSRLLAVARRRHREPTTLELGSLIARVAPVLRGAAGDGIQVDVATAGPLWVLADPLEVEQLVLNLVTNARNALNGRGVVKVAVAPCTVAPDASGFVGSGPPAGPAVAIAVEDDGRGIPPDLVDRIFEPFFTTGEAGKGVGLGLAVVERVAREGGGGVRLRSRPGCTRFEVVLPTVPAPIAPAEEEAGGEDWASRRLDIFIADDEEPVRKIVEQALTHAGHTVRSAPDGFEALEQLGPDARRPDLLITDVSMPGMDGFELLGSLRERFPGLPVIFISGLPEEFFERAGRSLGGRFEVLRKPFRLAALERVIRTVLEEP